jgi:replicative DNA helicase
VKLEPDERDRFAEIGGQLAHSLLTQVVTSPNYDDLPDRVKTSIFRRVFTQAHKVAAAQALPLEKRMSLLQEITEKVQAELTETE